jgi:transcriptional regulator of acetoin/glycerol metabolism
VKNAAQRIEAREGKPLPDVLIAALRKTNGDVKAAARDLGVDRKTVYRWIERHGIERRQVITAS